MSGVVEQASMVFMMDSKELQYPTAKSGMIRTANLTLGDSPKCKIPMESTTNLRVVSTNYGDF